MFYVYYRYNTIDAYCQHSRYSYRLNFVVDMVILLCCLVFTDLSDIYIYFILLFIVYHW